MSKSRTDSNASARQLPAQVSRLRDFVKQYESQPPEDNKQACEFVNCARISLKSSDVAERNLAIRALNMSAKFVGNDNDNDNDNDVAVYAHLILAQFYLSDNKKCLSHLLKYYRLSPRLKPNISLSQVNVEALRNMREYIGGLDNDNDRRESFTAFSFMLMGLTGRVLGQYLKDVEQRQTAVNDFFCWQGKMKQQLAEICKLYADINKQLSGFNKIIPVEIAVLKTRVKTAADFGAVESFKSFFDLVEERTELHKRISGEFEQLSGELLLIKQELSCFLEEIDRSKQEAAIAEEVLRRTAGVLDEKISFYEVKRAAGIELSLDDSLGCVDSLRCALQEYKVDKCARRSQLIEINANQKILDLKLRDVCRSLRKDILSKTQKIRYLKSEVRKKISADLQPENEDLRTEFEELYPEPAIKFIAIDVGGNKLLEAHRELLQQNNEFEQCVAELDVLNSSYISQNNYPLQNEQCEHPSKKLPELSEMVYVPQDDIDHFAANLLRVYHRSQLFGRLFSHSKKLYSNPKLVSAAVDKIVNKRAKAKKGVWFKWPVNALRRKYATRSANARLHEACGDLLVNFNKYCISDNNAKLYGDLVSTRDEFTKNFGEKLTDWQVDLDIGDEKEPIEQVPCSDISTYRRVSEVCDKEMPPVHSAVEPNIDESLGGAAMNHVSGGRAASSSSASAFPSSVVSSVVMGSKEEPADDVSEGSSCSACLGSEPESQRNVDTKKPSRRFPFFYGCANKQREPEIEIPPFDAV